MFKKFKSSKSLPATDNQTLNGLRRAIPNYIGYDGLKERKSSDNAYRSFLYDKVIKLVDGYSAVQTHLMRNQLLSTWSISNEILNMLTQMRNILSTDVYRHSTFFDTANVSDILDLSVIYVLESETIVTSSEVVDKVQIINDKLSNLELQNIEQDILATKSDIKEIYTIISDRAELIASFELVGF
ncbi:MAG: hypothetical protein OEY49_00970 [Candidatus Heimdallarchaeota archaeon]|nr:hypothetical protein [Candidatus Heimdallarchaeota archaeon]